MKKINFLFLFIILLNSNLISQNWVQLNSGTGNWLRAVYFINLNTGFAAGDYGIILKTTNAGLNWSSQIANNVIGLNAIAFKQNKGLIVGYSNLNAAIIMKTTNFGVNWTNGGWQNPDPTVFNSVSFIDSGTYMIGGNYLSSSDYNYYPIFLKQWTWNDSFHFFLPNVISQAQSSCFITPNTIFCVGGPPGNIMTSHDVGVTFNNVQWTLPLTSVFFINSNTGFITGYSGQMIRTTTGGNTWSQGSIGGTNVKLNSVFFVPQGSGYRGCVVDESGTIKMTFNLGINWITSYMLGNVNLSSVFFVDSLNGYVVGQNGTILKTTNGGGLTGTNNITYNIPDKFILSQNYPNPFNPSTTIKFSIPPYENNGGDGLTIRLNIYDVLGREVENLVNEKLKPGSYEVSWDAGNFSSGVYFYKLIATGDKKDFIDTKKNDFGKIKH